MSKPTLPRDEVIQELTSCIAEISEYIEEIFGSAFHCLALGLPPPDHPAATEPHVTAEAVRQYQITLDVESLLDYVNEGRWQELPGWPVSSALENLSLLQSLNANGFRRGSFPLLSALLEMAEARAKIETDARIHDLSDALSFRELALLAHLDERTVRNAASSKGEDRLPTYRSGGRAYIAPDAARAWLSRRPDFKPTEIIRWPVYEKPSYFTDGEGLGAFIRARREALGYSEIDLLQQLEWPDAKRSALTDIEAGLPSLALNEVTALAKKLRIKPEWFLKSFLRIHYSEELALLEGNAVSSDKLGMFKHALFRSTKNIEDERWQLTESIYLEDK